MKKFLTTITFLLIVVLFVGCNQNNANISNELINNAITNIDNIVATVNNLNNPNEETVKLSGGYQNSKTYRTQELKPLVYGDRNYSTAPNPRNQQNKYMNRNNFETSDYQNKNNVVNTSNANTNDMFQNTTTNNYQFSNLTSKSNEACNSCRTFIERKNNLLNNCSTCKNELQNILNNNIQLSAEQIDMLKNYNMSLTNLLNNLKNCKDCKNDINEIQNLNNQNNNNVLLSNKYSSLTDDLRNSTNSFDETDNTIISIIKMFNPNFQPQTQNQINNNTNNQNQFVDNNEYSTMPINNYENTYNNTNLGNNQSNGNNNSVYNYNKMRRERLGQGVRENRRNIMNNNNYQNNTNLEIKPNEVRA